MSSTMLYLVVIVLLLNRCQCNSTSNSITYCSTNNINRLYLSPVMHFTKEPISQEYAFRGKFKSIHCCVKEYRSIEWFKDGVPYPWSAGVSNMILYPESANQTLYAWQIADLDAGNYTCRISNETYSERFNMKLEVMEKPPDTPKLMFMSHDVWMAVGSPLRLFCEALIGRPYLADAKNDVRWMRITSNGTLSDLLSSQKELKTKREDVPEIQGSYLIFKRLSNADFGTYVCLIQNNNNLIQKSLTVHFVASGGSVWSSGEVPWRALVLVGGMLLVLLLSGVVMHRRCTPRLLLAARQARARAATATQRARVLEKDFDVLVCFMAVDGELVRGALLHTLAHKYNHRVYGLELSAQPDCWYSELIEVTPRARSVVAVLSPAQMTPAQLVAALRHLKAAAPIKAVVLLQDLPKLKAVAKESGMTLVSLLRGIKLLPWRHVHDKEFWTNLRLALPLPPDTAKVPSNQSDENKSRSGSLTALV